MTPTPVGAEHEVQGERRVGRARVGRRGGEQAEADQAEQGAGDHEGLADPQPVGQDTRDHERDRVRGPEVVGQRVRLLLGVAEGHLEVDDDEEDEDVVDEQEQADGQRGPDDVELEHLPPVALQRLLRVDAGRAGLDQGPVAHRDHELVAQPGRQLAQADERDQPDRQADGAADVELVPPVRVGVQRVRRHHGHDQAAEHRAQRPEPHRHAAADLRREVADERGRRHQRHPLDDAQQGVAAPCTSPCPSRWAARRRSAAR